jgi:hypothetical protein
MMTMTGGTCLASPVCYLPCSHIAVGYLRLVLQLTCIYCTKVCDVYNERLQVRKGIGLACLFSRLILFFFLLRTGYFLSCLSSVSSLASRYTMYLVLCTCCMYPDMRHAFPSMSCLSPFPFPPFLIQVPKAFLPRSVLPFDSISHFTKR